MQAASAERFLIERYSGCVGRRLVELNTRERRRCTRNRVANQFESVDFKSMIFDPGAKLVVSAVMRYVGKQKSIHIIFRLQINSENVWTAMSLTAASGR